MNCQHKLSSDEKYPIVRSLTAVDAEPNERFNSSLDIPFQFQQIPSCLLQSGSLAQIPPREIRILDAPELLAGFRTKKPRGRVTCLPKRKQNLETGTRNPVSMGWDGMGMICRKRKSLTEHHLKGHAQLLSVMICRECHDVLEWAKREGITSLRESSCRSVEANTLSDEDIGGKHYGKSC